MRSVVGDGAGRRLSPWGLMVLLTVGLAIGRVEAGEFNQESLQADPVSGDYLVMVAKGKNVDQVAATLKEQGYPVVEDSSSMTLRKLRAIHVDYDLVVREGGAAVSLVDQRIAMDRAAKIKNVEIVEANGRATPCNTVATDPLFGSLWYLNQIEAPRAWDVQKTSPGVVVGIVDSGTQLEHPDFYTFDPSFPGNRRTSLWENPREIPNNNNDDDNNGKIDDYYGWDFVIQPSDAVLPDPLLKYDPWNCNMDYYNFRGDAAKEWNEHGTHMAGTIGALANNSAGITGLSWNIKMMTLKIYGETKAVISEEGIINRPRSGCWTIISESMVYATDMSIRDNTKLILIIANTIGGRSTLVQNAVDYCEARNVLIVAPAGNNDSSLEVQQGTTYPGCYYNDNIICVGGSDQRDRKYIGSNWGETRCDLLAPGTGILSTFVTGGGPSDAAPNGTSTWTSQTGTSSSAAIVTGCAALVWAQNPGMTALQVKQRLMNTVDVLPELEHYVLTSGRINLRRAVGAASNANLARSQSIVDLANSGYLYAYAGYAYENNSTNSYAGYIYSYYGYVYAVWSDMIVKAYGRTPSYFSDYRSYQVVYDYYGYIYNYYGYAEKLGVNQYYAIYYSYLAYDEGMKDSAAKN